ncbi:MAG TPA: hypothetical protein VIJ17_05885 [Pseudolabrys sp.]
MIGPSKPPFMRFVISAAPTDFGRADAPMTAIDRGRNILSRLRIDMATFTSCALHKCGHFTKLFAHNYRELALIQVMSRNNEATTFI